MAERWRANEPWPKLEVQQLLQLRAEGHGPAEIARRLQRTENSVNSKIRQLHLPPMTNRPMPPKPNQPKRERAEPAPRVGKVSLPPLPSLADPKGA